MRFKLNHNQYNVNSYISKRSYLNLRMTTKHKPTVGLQKIEKVIKAYDCRKINTEREARGGEWSMGTMKQPNNND